MTVTSFLDFEVRVTGLAEALRVRIGASADRSVASVRVGSATTTGLGASAREALAAALAPLGPRITTAAMAAPDMFAASARLLTARSAG